MPHVFPVDIQYPTDSRLLNDAREALEEIIDVLHIPHIGICPKPRTYRQKARKEYLRFEPWIPGIYNEGGSTPSAP